MIAACQDCGELWADVPEEDAHGYVCAACLTVMVHGLTGGEDQRLRAILRPLPDRHARARAIATFVRTPRTP